MKGKVITIKLGKREREIVSMIFQTIIGITAVASFTTLCAVAPGLPIALKFLVEQLNKNKNKKLYPFELRKIFERMRRKRLVEIVEDKIGDIKVILQEKGIKYAIINNLDKIKFEKPKVWDKIWRVIIFDIPEKYKNERKFFSSKLKELNFYPLQKSVFVTPYPPYEIIDFLSEVLYVSPYVRIIEATKIDGEEEILAHFELKK